MQRLERNPGMMKRILLAAAVIVLLLAVPAQARTMYVQSTAYSVGCGGGVRTASGARGGVGFVAMSGVRFGTRVSVSRAPTGLRWHTVLDRHAPGSTGLDFWVPSCAKARAWGRRMVKVTFR